MPSGIERIRERIEALQEQLEAEVAEARRSFRYTLKNNRVVFEEGVRRRHRAFRIRLGTFLAQARPMHIVTAPVIYSLIVPILFLDLCVVLYQAICFPAYGIPKVPRAKHIRFDRHKLAYLNGLQKLNCVYCGYANGVISWVREVASRTEAYWCPIKHSVRLAGRHDLYSGFVDFGDAEGFEPGLKEHRRRVTSDDGTPPA